MVRVEFKGTARDREIWVWDATKKNPVWIFKEREINVAQARASRKFPQNQD